MSGGKKRRKEKQRTKWNSIKMLTDTRNARNSRLPRRHCPRNATPVIACCSSIIVIPLARCRRHRVILVTIIIITPSDGKEKKHSLLHCKCEFSSLSARHETAVVDVIGRRATVLRAAAANGRCDKTEKHHYHRRQLQWRSGRRLVRWVPQK